MWNIFMSRAGISKHNQDWAFHKRAANVCLVEEKPIMITLHVYSVGAKQNASSAILAQ